MFSDGKSCPSIRSGRRNLNYMQAMPSGKYWHDQWSLDNCRKSVLYLFNFSVTSVNSTLWCWISTWGMLFNKYLYFVNFIYLVKFQLWQIAGHRNAASTPLVLADRPEQPLLLHKWASTVSWASRPLSSTSSSPSSSPSLSPCEHKCFRVWLWQKWRRRVSKNQTDRFI